MSRLQQLIETAQKDASVLDRAYGPLPASLADDCGPDEVTEIVQRLDNLSVERDLVEDWDGDTQDDYWRAQKNFGELLSRLTGRYGTYALPGLESTHHSTRFWVAQALVHNPCPEAVPALESALRQESLDHVKKTIDEALQACSIRPAVSATNRPSWRIWRA